MQRVFYVPTSMLLTTELSEQAELLGLSVLHGESALSRYVDFDRDVAQAISLPSEKMCLFANEVPIMLHQSIEVTNDFVDMRDGVTLVLNGAKIIEPLILEKHYARYAIECTGYGVQVFDIFDKSMRALEHGEYYVVNPE